MAKEGDPPGLVSMFVPPALIVVSAVLLFLMPSEVLVALTVWTLVSLPIGILFGHCVLSEG